MFGVAWCQWTLAAAAAAAGGIDPGELLALALVPKRQWEEQTGWNEELRPSRVQNGPFPFGAELQDVFLGVLSGRLHR